MAVYIRRYGPDEELPHGICSDCRSAHLPDGRGQCQACGLVSSLQPAPARAWPDLSHGQPGHMCLLPRQAQQQAEAGS
jgi:hypothetical protein